ncbi:MAG: hypothetical protein HKP10_07950 [Kiritimatiellales bacterium]|nr:hypothetical protein [Kiritimatiellales bacterium]
MASKSISPIKTWIFWSILVIVAFLLITWDHFVQGFTQDSSKITWLIMGFFLYGFGTSFMVALKLQAEFNSIRRMEEDHRVGDANASDIAALFDSAMERIRRGDRIDVRTLVSAYGGKVRARVDNVGVISGMLITIGLLGTVVGLIITISGLDMVLQSNSADFATMKAGLTKTVSGMGTAFYTTFFGALLGGVVLKVLGSEMRKSAQTLVADALAFGELFISPQFAKKSSESLTELEERISVLHEQLASLGSSFGEVIETIDSKQTTLASGLGSLNEIIEKTSQQATERTDALVSTIGHAIAETSRHADERLAAISTTVEQTNREAAERSSALIEAITQAVGDTARQADERLNAISETLESTNQHADERMNAMSSALTSAVEQTCRMANEQIETIVDSVQQNVAQTNEGMAGQFREMVVASKAMFEEINRLANERLQSIVKAVENATQTTYEKADGQLAVFVDNVEQSIEASRRSSERKLSAKATDIVDKFNEVSTMLSNMMSAIDEPEAKDQPEGE